MSGSRTNLKTGTHDRSIASQQQIAWQAEAGPGAIVERYPCSGFGALGFDDQFAVYPNTLEL